MIMYTDLNSKKHAVESRSESGVMSMGIELEVVLDYIFLTISILKFALT